MTGKFGTTDPSAQFERDLSYAAGFKPVTQKDITTGYAQYSQAFGTIKRAASDSALYSQATDKVLAWWKAQQTSGPGTGNGGGTGTPPGVPGGSGTGSGGTGTGGTGTGGSGGYGQGYGSGYGLPNTALAGGAGVTRNPDLNAIPDLGPGMLVNRSAPILIGGTVIQRPFGTGFTESGDPGATRPAPTPPLTMTASRSILTQMGVPASWQPPTYALTDSAALRAWAIRAATQAGVQLKGAPLGQPAVNYWLNRMGVPASWVPPSYALVNETALKNWITRAATQAGITPRTSLPPLSMGVAAPSYSPGGAVIIRPPTGTSGFREGY